MKTFNNEDFNNFITQRFKKINKKIKTHQQIYIEKVFKLKIRIVIK